MEIAKLILEYIQALVWPLIVAGGLIYFRGPIRKKLGQVKKLDAAGVATIDFSDQTAELLDDAVAAADEPEHEVPSRTPAQPTPKDDDVDPTRTGPPLADPNFGMALQTVETSPRRAIRFSQLVLTATLADVWSRSAPTPALKQLAEGKPAPDFLTQQISDLYERGILTEDQAKVARRVLLLHLYVDSLPAEKTVTVDSARDLVEAAELTATAAVTGFHARLRRYSTRHLES